MITLTHTSAALIALFAGVWFAVALAATIAGLRRNAAARAAHDDCARQSELLAAAPAVPLLIDAEGRVTGDARFADWIGLPRVPRFLADFAGTAGSGTPAGLVVEDANALAADVRATQRSARPFARPLRIAGSARVLMAHGRAAEAAGRVIVWMFDATDTQDEIARLTADAARAARAIEALAALIEAAPFPMWHRGPDLRLALVNSAYVTAVEAQDAADVIARGIELVDGEGGRSGIAAAAKVRDEDSVATRTVPATLSGARRMMRIVDVPLGEAGVAGYAFDVDELEDARAALARFGRAQRDLLDSLSAGVAQFGADRALAFTNEPFRRLFAMRPEWLADAPEYDRVLERMREAGRLPESRDFPGWKRERRAWFAAADAVEEHWLLPGGVHLRVLAQPLPDGGLLLIFEDRTEQAQLASARDTLLRVRTATFDNLFEAIGVFAADGRLHLWNARFKDVWGLEDAELARRPRIDVLVEAVAKRLVNPAHAGLIRELVRIATTERQQRSGRVALADGRNFEFAAVPLPDGNALFTMLDVTDSRRIERALRDRNEALEQADAVKSAFVANMSYELRTPLTSISGFAEMLGAGYAGPLDPSAKDYVAAILESSAKLGAMIDDVLDLTQVEAGSLPMAEAPVDLASLCEEAAAAFATAAADRPVELDVRIDPNVGGITGDARRLRQTIDHLLRNAIAFTPPHGRILFQARGDMRAAEIIVSDNGTGMTDAEREAAFGPAPHGKGDGAAGLGLPLSRQFVEAHGGTLTLMSEPGKGTALIIRLPRKR